MNSLEFINQEIEYLNNKIKHLTEEPYTSFVRNYINYCGEKLEYLQQIKNELEAWEVVKNKLEYFKEDASAGIEESICQTSKFTPTEIKTYLKALEIEE